MQQPPPVAELLDRLVDFPDRLQRLLDRPDIGWQWRPAPGAWNLTQLACHFRDVEREVHQPRFRAVLAGDNAFLPGVSADSWAVERGYDRQDGRRALADFVAARRATAALLVGLDDALWQRTGRHAFFGNTSMHELLGLVVGHDEAHWRQAEELVP